MEHSTLGVGVADVMVVVEVEGEDDAVVMMVILVVVAGSGGMVHLYVKEKVKVLNSRVASVHLVQGQVIPR